MTRSRVERRGANETAHTLRQAAGQVFRYGVATGKCERNPAADLAGALAPVIVKNAAAQCVPCRTSVTQKCHLDAPARELLATANYLQ